jgi:hypothetical protein
MMIAGPVPIHDFAAAADAARESGDLDAITYGELERVMTAAVRLYAAKSEHVDGFPPPPITAARVTATDVVVTVSEMVKTAGLNLFDLSMWFRR